MRNLIRNMNPFSLSLLVGWSLAWKGLALWRAARLKQPRWFAALLVVNTVGIIEMLYLMATNKEYQELYGHPRRETCSKVE